MRDHEGVEMAKDILIHQIAGKLDISNEHIKEAQAQLQRIKVLSVIKDQIGGLPHRKLVYVINQPSLVEGLWIGMVNHYGVANTQENYQLLVDEISTKLEYESYIEHEWTENEWKTFASKKVEDFQPAFDKAKRERELRRERGY